ncbi:MAG: hypothetical protein AAF829_03920 [Pseudomonadota bacterium]
MAPVPLLMRWREIVHPLFWPVFFWNLRRFVRVLDGLRERQGDYGQLSYGITWWGAIQIRWVIPETAPDWDETLGPMARRIHLATLDVLNPYLCAAVPGRLGCGLLPVQFYENAGPLAQATSTGRVAWIALNTGRFPQPEHLNTS